MAGKNESQAQVIRLPFWWVIFGVIGMVVVGAIGGVLAGQLWPPVRPLSDSGDDRLITSIQEVTISPNRSRSEVVTAAQDSVVLLGTQSQGEPVIAATGTLVTNDGLLVTAGTLPAQGLVAFADQGAVVPVRVVGADAVFGLTYARLQAGERTPLDLAQAVPGAGETLAALTRHEQTLQPFVRSYTIHSFDLPEEGSPAGWQRLLRGAPFASDIDSGTPLLDEEGRMAGLLVTPETGLALPVDLLRVSIDRVINGQREADPFEAAGIELTYDFRQTADATAYAFTAVVTSVTPRSSAAVAGVEVGDEVTAVGEQNVTWGTSLAALLDRDLPFALTVQREGREHVLTLEKQE